MSARPASLCTPTRISASSGDGGVVRVGGQPVGWVLSLCREAGEAGGSFRSASRREPARGGITADPERAALEGARRARSKLRKYCAANRLNRLGTLTYAGAGCHDPHLLRGHVGVFFRRLRAGLGGRALPYAWVPEWHKTDHGLHVHFAVGQFVQRSLIESAWGRGFVHIKLLGDLPVGTGALGEARRAAGYLGKYVAKSFEDVRRIAGLHRYEVAEGFQPAVEKVWGRTRADAIDGVCTRMDGQRPETLWFSNDAEGWQGPPAVWLAWPG